MALKDIVNSAKYADDMVISLPDGTTMTVGEMRSLEAEEKQRLIQRSQTLEQAELALADRIVAAQRRGVQLSEEIQPTDREIRREAAAQFGLSEDDPLLGQVAKEFKRLDADNKAREAALEAKFTQELNNLKGITGKAIQVSLDDRYATQFELATKDMPKTVREKLKLEDAVNYATEHRIMDKAGRYQIDKAVEMLSWNDMKEHERAEMRTELQTKAQREAEMARMNRPSPNALRTKHAATEGFNPLDDKGRVKSLDEALADAAEDDNLWNSLATAASGFGPN
jgi:hypothetical protein